MEIKIKNFFTYILIYLLIFSSISFIPSFISIIARYLFILLGTYYIFLLKGTLKKTKFHLLIYMYCIFAIFSFILSPYININIFLSTIQFCLIILILVNIEIILDLNNFLDEFFKVLTYIVIIAVFYSLLLAIFGNHIYEFGVRKNYFIFSFISQEVHGLSLGDFGYSSFYTNPNIFGYYLFVLLCQRLFINNQTTKKQNFLIFMIIFIGILLANSRAINILSICAILVYLFYKLKLRYRYIIVPFIIICVCIIFVYFINSGFLLNSDILTGRLEFWEEMITSIKQYPIFGIGFSSSTKYVVGSLDHIVGSHNSYLNILCENGIIGFSIFILILFKIGKKVITISFENKHINKYCLLSCCIFLLMIPYAFFENVYMILDVRNYIWIFICLIINQYSNKIKQKI